MTKDCKTCIHDGMQMIYPSGCTGCGAHTERLNYLSKVDNLDEIAKLKQERDELAAQLEVMRDALNTCVTIPGDTCEQLFNIPMVKKALSITPSAALREIEARVLEYVAIQFSQTQGTKQMKQSELLCKQADKHGNPTESIKERFFSRISKNNEGCWNWTKGKSKGYGVIYFKGSMQRANRVSYTLHFGDIPDGMCVCHKCDNPECVNPDHLFLGTQKDNMHDMVNKKRHLSNTKPSCYARGERTACAKLNAESVSKIRDMRSGGVMTKELAEKFCVSTSSIRRIVARVTWDHIT